MQREAAIHPQVQLCIGKLKPTTKHLFSCLKCEEDEGVHSQFQALLAEVSEPGPGCCLTIANRLFGEITYPFFQVRDCGLPCNKQLLRVGSSAECFPSRSTKGHMPFLPISFLLIYYMELS